MDFFKSVFSEDPDPPTPQPESQSSKNKLQPEESSDPNPPPNPQPSSAASGWSFGGLIKTLTIKSESVIETYRRDLQEFGTGLKKELEVAQGSIGTVSTVIDEFGNTVLKGTAQIISHGKDAILAIDNESDSSDNNNNINNQITSGQRKPYSRFDAQVRAIQGDLNTYCEEVDDLDDYNKWKSGFVLDKMNEEIESLFEENGAMEGIYKKVVPNSVDHETFWHRYFYRVFKLKQAEDLRVSLVKRAISTEEDEVLSWDVDDDDDDGENKRNLKETEDMGRKNSGKDASKGAAVEVKSDLSENRKSDDKASEKTLEKHSLQVDDDGGKISMSKADEVGKTSAAESSGGDAANEKVKVGTEKNIEMNKEDSGLKSDEKVALVDKGDTEESSKNSDFSVVSSQPSIQEEEDLGWDEIEDLSSIDEKKVTHAGSPNRADLRKRLSVAEEEEDLSWDIEDDDEPVKA